jgi:ribosomal protein S18 acetylase RimI-like enzyme
MLVVRDATPADAHEIATVDVTSWQATYRGFIADDVLAGMSVANHERDWLDRITGAPPRSDTLVLTRHAAVVGFAATGPPRMTDDHTTGELHALYLAPDAWGHGLGARLHTSALDRLRASGFLRACLWVLDNNTRARRFYDRHGWHDTGHTVVDQKGSGLLIRQLHCSLFDSPEGQ